MGWRWTYKPLHHDDVIKWKHFTLYWTFLRGIHRSPVNSAFKGQWRGALMFSLICAWINGWVNNREAGDLGRHRAHYDVIVKWTNDDKVLRHHIASPSHNEFTRFYLNTVLCSREKKSINEFYQGVMISLIQWNIFKWLADEHNTKSHRLSQCVPRQWCEIAPRPHEIEFN